MVDLALNSDRLERLPQVSDFRVVVVAKIASETIATTYKTYCVQGLIFTRARHVHPQSFRLVPGPDSVTNKSPYLQIPPVLYHPNLVFIASLFLANRPVGVLFAGMPERLQLA